MAKAAAEFDKISGVEKAARDELRASVSHSHNISDLPFMKNPAEALAQVPQYPQGQDGCSHGASPRRAARTRVGERGRGSASHQGARRISQPERRRGHPAFVHIQGAKAGAEAGQWWTEGLDVPDSVGERIGESMDNLAKARAQGHPFGFANKAQYEQFISTVDKEVAARGIKGQAKVQGSAMHSKAPGDIDMEIVVDQVEFDRLAKRFVDNAPTAKDAAAVKASIAKKKIPSYEFFPDDSPSVASAAKKFTQGADGKELEVQATLIVKGSDCDLGPFL